MSNVAENKAIVGRWFMEFWGKTFNLGIVDELASPDMLLQYSLHEPRRGRADIKAFMENFRKASPDLNFRGTAELIAEGDYVVGQWEGGGTHAGPAFNDFLVGSLPPATGHNMHFTGISVLKVVKGKIVEEIGLHDGVTALIQLGVIAHPLMPSWLSRRGESAGGGWAAPTRHAVAHAGRRNFAPGCPLRVTEFAACRSRTRSRTTPEPDQELRQKGGRGAAR